MTVITRDNVRLPLRVALALDDSGNIKADHKTYAGTLVWDTDHRTLKLVHPETREVLVVLSGSNAGLNAYEVRLLDVRATNSAEDVSALARGALSALRTLGVVGNFRSDSESAGSTIVEMCPDLGVAAQAASTRTATVTLFKGTGKYYTKEAWALPVNAILPSAMIMSPDFRRIDGGAVLVDADDSWEFPGARNWGFPELFPSE